MTNEYTERQCPHNRCLNHNPQFESRKEEKADFKPSWIFKILTFFEHFCCKKEMKIQQVIDIQQCAACGRKKLLKRDYYKTLCECCGYHYEFMLTYNKISSLSLISAIISFLSLLAGLVLALLVNNSGQSAFIVFGVIISIIMVIVFGQIFLLNHNYSSQRKYKE